MYVFQSRYTKNNILKSLQLFYSLTVIELVVLFIAVSD